MISEVSFGMTEIAKYAKEYPFKKKMSQLLMKYQIDEKLPPVDRFEDYLSQVISEINSIKEGKVEKSIYDSFFLHFALNSRNERNLSSVNKSEILYTYSFLKQLSDSINSPNFSIDFLVENYKGRLLIKEIQLRNESHNSDFIKDN